jgi:protein TonB
LPTYRLAAPYAQSPLRRRLSGVGLALAVNAGLIAILLTLGVIPLRKPEAKLSGTIIDLAPLNKDQSEQQTQNRQVQKQQTAVDHPTPKPPPIILPVKPTIRAPEEHKPAPWLEMSKEDMAASDISKLARSGSAGDSEVVGRGPNGEAMYAAEWAREPTDAEMAGYVPKNSNEGYGLVACKTIPNNRVEDCVELGQTPGTRLASALRQAAWQFHVRPPRKGGKPLIGSWVRIRFDYYSVGGSTDRSGD